MVHTIKPILFDHVISLKPEVYKVTRNYTIYVATYYMQTPDGTTIDRFHPGGGVCMATPDHR